MGELFLKVTNISICAGYLILTVLLLRPLFKKTPKWVTVLLWGLVAIRLLCPISIESGFSLIPSRETFNPEIMLDGTPEIASGIAAFDKAVNPLITQAFAPNPGDSMNPLQLWIPLAAAVWLLGVAVMLIYTAVSYILLRRRVATAVLLKGNIYQSENVDSPFVLGIIKPRIYLPFSMNAESIEYVVAHEEAHIRRKDHWWKPLGFALLILHWFNPLMWLGYIFLCRDIELACDEKVIEEMDNEKRADYMQALVTCSANRRSIAACPLAFGEVGVKTRVKSVMNYRKPAFYLVAAAIVICVGIAICFLTDPVKHNDLPIDYDSQTPAVVNPWVQEYTPGAEGIAGKVDTQKYTAISPDFEIGADKLGIAVFKDPHKAFMTMTSLYLDAIAAIQMEFDLPPLSESDYEAYKTYGWQITSNSVKLQEQSRFITQFFDIYENSFTDHTGYGDYIIVDMNTGEVLSDKPARGEITDKYGNVLLKRMIREINESLALKE